MFPNPEIQDFINRQIGGATPGSRVLPPPSPEYRGALARALLGDVTMPRQFGSFAAPAIRPGRGLEPSLPSPGFRGGQQQVLSEAQFHPPSGNTGASALTAGLGKIGAGIEGGLEQFKANKDAAATAAAGRRDTPSAFLTPPTGAAAPSRAATPAPFGTPPQPTFSPVGISNPTLPTQAQLGAGYGPVGGPVAVAGSLPYMARLSPSIGGNTAANVGNTAGAGLQNQIAQYIVDYATKRGVDPNLALGIAAREGLDRSDILSTKPDGTIGGIANNAIGPFQLGTAGLGKQLGVTPNTPWQTQVEKSIDYMAAHNQAQITGTWNSIPDNGGWDAITRIGKNYAGKLGISPGGGDAAGATAFGEAPRALPSGALGYAATPPTGTAPTGASGPIPPNAPMGNATGLGPGGSPYDASGAYLGYGNTPGPQGMLTQPQPNALADALTGQANPIAPPMMSPGVVAALDLGNFNFGGGLFGG